jgi:hypothetical protein
MATPLDVGFLQNFSILFPFLLTFSIVLAILSMAKAFGDNKAIHAIIAFCLAVLVLFSDIATATINRMAPWFVILFFFIVFTLIAYMVFGATEKDIMGVLKSKDFSYINYWIIALALVIGIGSLTSVISERGGIGKTSPSTVEINRTGMPEQTSDFWATLTHPKILGMILILLVAMFTIQRLAGKYE